MAKSPNSGQRPSGPLSTTTPVGTPSTSRNTGPVGPGGALKSPEYRKAQKITNLLTKIKELEKQQKGYTDDISRIDKEISGWINTKNTTTNPDTYIQAEQRIKELTSEKAEITTKLQKVISDLKAANTERNKLINNVSSAAFNGKSFWQTGGSGSGGSGSDTDLPKTFDTSTLSLKWKYNPPMVKAAYMTPKGLQAQDGWLAVDNSGSWKDAIKAWQVATGSREMGSKGVIQMSRKYPYQAYSWNADKQEGKYIEEDTTIYGFKFLYNPTTVQMAWGVSTEIDPSKFATGQLVANPITDAALNSSITFSLILNRMLDMNVVTSTGLLEDGDYYPLPVSDRDARGIYEKGTMHDLEYLFRAVNGVGVQYSAPLQKYLNLKTSDLGWLQSFPVELHLGNSLRYLVRLTSINVEHKIFNERMVPIFSTVDLVCKRLPDVEVNPRREGRGGGGSSSSRPGVL